MSNMDPKDITVKPDEPEAPGSTTEDVLKALMRDRNGASDSDDGLTNPELEKLVGTLSTELDQGLLENLSGVTATAPLTLEELASAQAAPVTAESERTDYGDAVPCGRCGHNNSPSTLFCGMCGADLRSPSAIGADLANEVRQMRPEISPAPAEIPKFLAEAAAKPAPSRMSVVLLVLLLVLLGVVIAQQWSLWRGSLSAGWNRVSGASGSPQPPPVASRPQPSKAAVSSRPNIPGQPPPVHSPSPTAVSSKAPSKAIPKLSPKTARNEKVRPAENETEPATTVKRTLEGPAPLTSPTQQKELPLPAIPAIAESAPQPKAGGDVGVSAQRRQISQGVAAGALIYKVDPDYPSVARNARIQGAVVLHGVIAKDGTIRELRVVKGSPLLVGAAIATQSRNGATGRTSSMADPSKSRPPLPLISKAKSET